MSEAPLPGPLDDFLGHPPADNAAAAFRRDLLRQTTALVRRRRWQRRLIVAAAVAAAVLLVIGAIWRLVPAGPEAVDGPQPQAAQKLEPPAPAPPVEKPRVPEVSHPALPSALALEWKAFDAPRPQRAALYQQAGDRYVEEEQDVASALRCYGQAVQTAQAGELQIDPDDNWLVMALKFDEIERRREK